MKWLGNLTEDQIIYFRFSTHKADGTPITLGGTPAISVYKDDSDTQSTAGITLSVDDDSVTGMHTVKIDTSADAFYATGSDYSAVITTGTVDSVSVVGTVLATFSIENRFNEATVTSIAANAITATSIAADAITEAKIADNAIAAEHIAANAIDLATFAADVKTGSALKANVETITANAITSTAIQDGAITNAKFAAGAIDAAAIANGAIDAATFAADVDAEILSYIVDDATRIDASSLNTATVTSIPAILDDTGTAGVVVAAGSKTGYTLTATTGLGNQTANITGTVSGNSTHDAAAVVTALGTGSTLTAIPWNASWDAEVQSECDDAITANTLIKRIMPAVAGTVSGAGTGTEVFVYGGVTMTVTVDANGNRSVIGWS